MDEREILEIVGRGEDSCTEFKEERAHPSDLAAELVAFANSEGGTILIGVSDRGDIIGVSDCDKAVQKLDNIASNNCEPPVVLKTEKVCVQNKTILAVRVPKGIQRPYRTNRGVHYIRTSSGKRPATREELLRLYQVSRSIFYDELPIPGTSAKDIDILYFRRYFETFYQRRIEETGIDLPVLLRSMKILTITDDGEAATVAGFLCFGLDPQKHLPFCKISVARFHGNQVGEEFEKKDCEGKIAEQIAATEILLNLYLKTTVRIQGFQKETKHELPMEAIREAVINAIAHRDYHLPSQIRIMIFDNRIEVISPGKLPNTVTLENIRFGVHSERNPLIVSYLSKMGYMTQIGMGIVRMIRLLREHTGREPDFAERGNEFVVTIWRK